MSTRMIGGPSATPMRSTGGGQVPLAGAGTNSLYAGQGAGTVGGVAEGFSQFVQAGSSLFGGSPQGGGGEASGGSQGSGSIPKALPFKSPILEKAKQQQATPDKSADKPKESSRSVVFEDEGGGGGDYGGE